jgi:hypothetical protein
VLLTILFGGVVALAVYGTRDVRSPALRALTAVVMVTSYPVLFAADRANLEIVVFAALGLFVAGVVTERFWVGLVGLSIAIAMKGTPFALGVLLLPPDVVRAAARTVAVGVAVVAETIIGLALLQRDPVENVRLLAHGVATYNAIFLQQVDGLQYGHSLYGLVRSLAILVGGESADAAVTSRLYLSVGNLGLSLLALVALIVWRWPADLWRRLTVLTASMLLLTPVSTDYRLILMLLPFALFLRAWKTVPRTRGTLICYAALFIPKMIDPTIGRTSMEVAILLNATVAPVALLGLIVLSVQGWRSPGRGASPRPIAVRTT